MQRRHHGFIGTEHLVLGLLADNDTAARRILRDAGADFDAALRMTMLYLGDRRIPFTDENVRFIATSRWRVHVSPPTAPPAGQAEI